MRILIAILVPWFAATVMAGEPTPFELADHLDLLPTPRSLALTGDTWQADEISIVATTDRDLVATGVEEVNDRLVSLGHPPCPVSSQWTAGNLLVLATCDTSLGRAWADRLDVTPTAPGPQGYAIGVFRDGDRMIVAAIGSDDLGTLYASMTLRQLFQRREGNVALLGARVRDWPAFQRRCLGSIGRTFRGSFDAPQGQETKEAFVETWKAYIRFLGRNKINMTTISVSSAMGDPVRRQLMEYGRRYGLKYRYTFGTAINEDLEATGTPWTDCVTRQSARHCWTAFEAHRHKAERTAELVHEVGYDYVVLHVTDSGGLPDPENWSQRCQRCRDHYGDDQARAVSEQLKLYHDAIKRRNPDVLFEAVLQPYHFQWAAPWFEENPLAAAADMPHSGHSRGMEDPDLRHAAVARATAIHRATSALLPDDVLVTFREAGRAEFDACAALWPGHPVDIWVYYGRNQAWEGLWEPQVRFTKTWVRQDDPGDVIYNAPVGRMATVNEVYAAGSAEYAWNIEQPDAEPTFEIFKRRFETGGKQVSDYQRESLLPRLCRRLWGRSGDAVLPLFANNVSFNYIGDPEYAASTRGENFGDVYQYWQPMTAILEQARQEINTEVARIDAGESTGVYGNLRNEPGYTSFMWLYYYTNLAAVKGQVETAVLELQRMVYDDEIDAAKALAEQLRERRLPQWLHEVEAVKSRMNGDGDIRYRPRWRPTPPGGKPSANALNGPYFEDLPERIAKLIPAMLQDAQLGAIPEHLRQPLSERTVEAARVEFRNPFRADGGRGEGGWTTTRPVEFFTIAGRDALARYPTRAWVVWDDEALSLIAEMIDAPGAKAVAKVDEHDGPLFEDDCFEVFLKPSEQSETYYHFAVNANGTKYESIGRRPAEDWNPTWEGGAAQRAGRWSAELRIPFAVLGAAPKDGDSWQINLGRNRAPKPRSPRREISNVIDSASHHDVEQFRPLVFRTSGVSRPKTPVVKLLDVTREDATTTYGFATQLALRPEITAWVQASDVDLTMTVYEGDELLASQAQAIPSLPGYWKSGRLMDMDLGRVVRGDLRVVVTTVGDLATETEFVLDPSGKVQ